MGNTTTMPSKPQKKKTTTSIYKKKRGNLSSGRNSAKKVSSSIKKKPNALNQSPNLRTNTSTNGLGFAMRKRMTIIDFTFLKVVGKGSFGKLMQVRKNDDRKIYALIISKKNQLVKNTGIVSAYGRQRRILSGIDNPFIVALRYSFQSDLKLYMILDFFNGGELFFHLKNEGRFSQKRSKFYSGEICLALKCLHSNGIIYSDLKPHNVLLNDDGHIKITDLDLSKDSLKDDMIIHTFCGTIEYLAPEILAKQDFGKVVDWWSFGTLLYEMMTGLTPFYNTNLNIMIERVLHAPIPLPKYLSKEARSIFLNLLEKDPKKRLGFSSKDAIEIQTHPFYKDIDWDKLYNKEIRPPFKPKVKDQYDASNVDNIYGAMIDAKDTLLGFTYDQNSSAIDTSLKVPNINSQQKSQLHTFIEFTDCDRDSALKYLGAVNWDFQIATDNYVQDHPDHPKSRQASMDFDNISLSDPQKTDNAHGLSIDNDNVQQSNDLGGQYVNNLFIIDTLGNQSNIQSNNDKNDNNDDNDNPNIVDTKGNDIKINNKDDMKSNPKESVQKQFYNFLKDVNMENYFQNFVDNNCCDMESIKYFDDDILKNEINISSKIQRLKLLGHCDKFKIEMNKFINDCGVSSLIQKLLAKYGVVTLDILYNQVKNKNDLRTKFHINNNNQIEFLWKLVHEYENINQVEGF